MKGISIFSLAISFSFLVSNVASAETLRLECNISSACMMAKGASCTFINPPVSLLTDIDLRLKNWIQYWTQRDGAVSTSSGKLSSIDETKIVFAKGPAGSGEEEAISQMVQPLSLQKALALKAPNRFRRHDSKRNAGNDSDAASFAMHAASRPSLRARLISPDTR